MRATACAGVLPGCPILGDGAVGLAVADPSGFGNGRRDEGSSKGVNSERAGRAGTIRRVAGERRRRHHHVAQDPPPTTFGSGRESAYAATESNVATFGDVTEPAPEVAPDTERGADPDGNATGGADPFGSVDDVGGDGSDYIDNTVVSTEPVLVNTPDGFIEYPYPYLLLQLRRGGGDWWNADRIISGFGQAIGSYLPAPPEPEPDPVPGLRSAAGHPSPSRSSIRRVALAAAVATTSPPTSAVRRRFGRRSSRFPSCPLPRRAFRRRRQLRHRVPAPGWRAARGSRADLPTPGSGRKARRHRRPRARSRRRPARRRVRFIPNISATPGCPSSHAQRCRGSRASC